MLIESWYKSAVAIPWRHGTSVDEPECSYMYSRGRSLGIHITTQRVQIPYTLETHGTTICGQNIGILRSIVEMT